MGICFASCSTTLAKRLIPAKIISLENAIFREDPFILATRCKIRRNGFQPIRVAPENCENGIGGMVALE